MRVDEEDIQAALLRAEQLLCQHPDLVASTVQYMERVETQANGRQVKIYEIDQQIAAISAQVHLLTQLQTSGILDAGDFAEQNGRLTTKLSSLRSERNTILRGDDQGGLADLKELSDALVDYDLDTSDNLIRSFLLRINVKSETDIEIHLRGGLVLPEKLPQKKRR